MHTIKTILLSLALSGCTGMASDAVYTTNTVQRNVGYTIKDLPNEARYCATSQCTTNYNNSILDNAKRGYKGSAVRATGNLVEDTTYLILSPIINATKDDSHYPTLEENYSKMQK